MQLISHGLVVVGAASATVNLIRSGRSESDWLLGSWRPLLLCAIGLAVLIHEDVLRMLALLLR